MTTNTNRDADALAKQVLNVKDWRRMEAAGLSPSEYVSKQYDVDPSEHRDESELKAAVLSARNEGLDDTENVAAEAVGGSDRTFGDSETEIASLSESVMTVSDWREAERTDTDPQEYVAETYGVDPTEHRSEKELRKAISEAKQ